MLMTEITIVVGDCIKPFAALFIAQIYNRHIPFQSSELKFDWILLIGIVTVPSRTYYPSEKCIRPENNM